MVVLDAFPGLDVTVEVAGEPAKEYADPENPSTDDHSVRFIEAKRGASFAIRLKKSRRFRQPIRCHHLAWTVDVDNAKSSIRHESDKSSPTRHLPWENVRSWITDGDARRGYFHNELRFSDLATTSDDVSADQLRREFREAKNCGVIVVKVFYMLKSGKGGPRSAPTFEKASEPGTLHEKSLKGQAKDCHVSFDPKPFARSLRGCKAICHYVDRQKRPFATFEFRYRYLEGLIREGIVPRPSAAQALLDGMSAEETRRLALELLEERQNRDNDNKDAPGPVKQELAYGVKREASVAGDGALVVRYKQRRLDNGKVEIDLTDD